MIEIIYQGTVVKTYQSWKSCYPCNTWISHNKRA